MKNIISLLALTLSLSAFAQERVVLDSKNVQVNAAEAILVRTSQSPDVVKVTFQIPMSQSVCEAYGTTTTIVTSGLRCGYHQRVTGHTTRSTCVRRNPHNDVCLRTRTERIPVIHRIARSCPVTTSYCSRYGTVTQYEADEVKIKFKKLPALGGTEEDTFLIKARQKNHDGGNVIYDIEVLNSLVKYEVKDRGFLGSDTYVIKVK